MRVDVNADVGESYGPYRLGNTEALLRHVTSASIACGFHAGDPRVMRDTVVWAAQAGVAIGAHVGYPDRIGFGRRRMGLLPLEISTDVLYQIGALYGFCRAQGVPVRHVKAHGALYLQAVEDPEVARALVAGVIWFGESLRLFCPPSSAMEEAAGLASLETVREGFPDRAYGRDGHLVSRREPNAVFEDPDEVARRAVRMVVEGRVKSVGGEDLDVEVDSLCIHGDAPGAVEKARAIEQALAAAHVEIAPPWP